MNRVIYLSPDHLDFGRATGGACDGAEDFQKLDRLRSLWLKILRGDEAALALVLAVVAGTSFRRYGGETGMAPSTVKWRFDCHMRLIRLVGTLADQAHLHWRARGGFTFDFATRTAVDLPPGTAAVSLDGHERTPDGEGAPFDIGRYVADHLPMFDRPYQGHKVYLGGSSSDGRLVLDLSVVVPRADALTWCVRENQRTYFADDRTYPNPSWHRDGDQPRPAA
jgi:hypothetical protein